MLDFFFIITRGGFILYSLVNNQSVNSKECLNELICSIFIEEKTNLPFYQHKNTRMEFKMQNNHNLIMIAGYNKNFHLPYIKNLLNDLHTSVNQMLVNTKRNDVDNISTCFRSNFDQVFSELLSKHEEKFRTKTSKVKTEPTKDVELNIDSPTTDRDLSFNSPTTNRDLSFNSPTTNTDNLNSDGPNQTINVDIEQQQQQTTETQTTNENTPSKLRDPVQFFKDRTTLQNKKNNNSKPDTSSAPKSKQARVWDNSKNGNMQDLDFSNEPDQTTSNINHLNVGSPIEKVDKKINLSLEDSTKKSEGENNTKDNGNSFFRLFRGFVGNKTITNEMIKPVLTKMKEHLCSKNVAFEIAENLCQSLAVQLEGRVLGSFESLNNCVRNSLINSVKRILTPTSELNLISEVHKTNSQQKKTHSIVFCGVNGVGKSTNLAKIAFYLMSNNFRVLIAACDTFRSGAVEQLRTHINRLNHIFTPDLDSNTDGTPFAALYDKGYGKDAALVAKEALFYAENNNFNVCLIDTAGRMQNNEPLMRSLAKLIQVNNPNLVLFVGEALVGNDGVDQLTKFNNALKEQSSSSNPHLIDGIILTKFDTIDDKVGAALSMTYLTGKPIVFVGVGQTYHDLKKLEVDPVIRLLFK